MAGTHECNPTIVAGRLSKAVEFFDAAEHLENDMPSHGVSRASHLTPASLRTTCSSTSETLVLCGRGAMSHPHAAMMPW